VRRGAGAHQPATVVFNLYYETRIDLVRANGKQTTTRAGPQSVTHGILNDRLNRVGRDRAIQHFIVDCVYDA